MPLNPVISKCQHPVLQSLSPLVPNLSLVHSNHLYFNSAQWYIVEVMAVPSAAGTAFAISWFDSLRPHSALGVEHDGNPAVLPSSLVCSCYVHLQIIWTNLEESAIYCILRSLFPAPRFIIQLVNFIFLSTKKPTSDLLKIYLDSCGFVSFFKYSVLQMSK